LFRVFVLAPYLENSFAEQFLLLTLTLENLQGNLTEEFIGI